MNNKNSRCKLRNSRHLTPCFLVFFSVIISFLSCKSKNNLPSTSSDTISKLWCPESDFCELEILIDKHLQLKKDKFGMSYVEISEGNKIILKFKYKRTENLDLSDSNYREEVFVILDPNEVELETNNFKRTPIIFGRWCFCKGQAGNFGVRKGKLSIKKLKNNFYHLKLNFKVDEVPQIISNINHVFNLSV
ncbi:hypothetical protein [Seonamhaeicola aphaedonensis]|uniref:Uncharacterized protein n=1 Tax=Seonamhaeicola aphaedonensis TaxID=1461338 RepID=A0A3D9HM85_9FLAO|nr:hypothetical protein [Seonamhaeicola aphaedonensis]RED50589.1 hypothetical protein DFQ02_101624 [Seonamhaeicola aphaedonensis]